jgi:hypothetical protein
MKYLSKHKIKCYYSKSIITKLLRFLIVTNFDQSKINESQKTRTKHKNLEFGKEVTFISFIINLTSVSELNLPTYHPAHVFAYFPR